MKKLLSIFLIICYIVIVVPIGIVITVVKNCRDFERATNDIKWIWKNV